MNIVLTGSLGHIGKPLAAELAQKGHAVTVISNSPDRQAAIEALGATAAIGSLEDAAFLTKAFAGADAVFAMVPPNRTELDHVAYYKRLANNYAQAIQDAGVKRVVYLSSYGADLSQGTGFILGSHVSEAILNTLPGLSVTHLRPGYFYYNLENFIGLIKAAGIVGSNYGGDDRIVMVAPADIAAVAAEELTKPGAAGATVRYIASDERTPNQIAPIIGAAIGKPDLAWLTFSDEQVQQGMEQAGLPSPVAAAFVELGAAIHSGIMMPEYEKNRPATFGKTKLEDYAKEFAEAYNRA